jgi:hypothetical protein
LGAFEIRLDDWTATIDPETLAIAGRWLTADRLVQRTRFGDTVTLTANFGTTTFEGIMAGCLRLEGVPGGRRETFCPVTARKGRTQVSRESTGVPSFRHFW